MSAEQGVRSKERCRRCSCRNWSWRQSVGDPQEDCSCSECLTDEELQFMKAALAAMDQHGTAEGRA